MRAWCPLSHASHGVASPPSEIRACVSPRRGAQSVRTFKRRGGLADDSSSTSHSLILLFRRRRSEKRSPAVVPPLSLRCVCNMSAGLRSASRTDQPSFCCSPLLRDCSEITSCMHIECETAVGTLMGRVCALCHEILHCLRCGRFQRSREKDVWVQGLLAQPSPHVDRVRVL